MINSEKYLKYKTKFFELQKRLNNYQIGGVFNNGTKVITQSNSGMLDGMKNQCFWISILNYLNKNGYPKLTLQQLRTEAGLDDTTKYMPFDVDYKKPFGNGKYNKDGKFIFMDAAERIARKYKLQLQIYAVTSNGSVIGPRAHIGLRDAPHLINIAQFGETHFERIRTDETRDNSYGEHSHAVVAESSTVAAAEDKNPFKPRIENSKGDLVEATQKDNRSLIEAEIYGTKKALQSQIDIYEKNKKEYDSLLSYKLSIKKSDLDSDSKTTVLTEFGNILDEFVTKSIIEVERKIEDLKGQLQSLQIILKE
jgi:hypothetical protein